MYSREPARQVAFALAPLDRETRQIALMVLASLAAKTEHTIPRVADVTHALEQIDRLGEPTRMPRFQRRVHGAERQAPLPVEAARAVGIETVLEREGLTLRRAGRELVARCPFHEDRRPSFRVNPKKGTWYCDPCGTGGDAIAFVMRQRGLSFADAVRAVAA